MEASCNRMTRVPRAFCPKHDEYIVVALVLQEDYFYNLTQETFVANCMKYSNGRMHPERAKQIYKELMDEAGLPVL